MRKIPFTAVALAIAATSVAQNPKIDGVGMEMLDIYHNMERYGAEHTAGIATLDRLPVSRGGAPEVGVFVTLNPGYGPESLAPYGASVESQAEDMVVVSMSLADVEAMADDPAVKYVQFGRERTVLLDQARAWTNVDAVHDGTGLAQSFDGTGVICGVVDTGLDPGNINFLEDDLDTPRVTRFWAFSSDNGTYKEYAGEDIWGVTTDNAAQTHGTHVAGIMAGSYNQAGGTVATIDLATNEVSVGKRAMPYYGMAPGSTIAMCGLRTLHDPNITTGVENILKYAKAEGLPAVVNVSLGSIVGAHDNSDPVAAYFSRLGKDGIICVAAGNDGDASQSIAKTFTSNDYIVRTMVNAPRGSQSQTTLVNNRRNSISVQIGAVSGSGSFAWSVNIPEREGSYTYANSSYNNSSYITSSAFDAAFTDRSFVRAVVSITSTNRYMVSLTYSLTPVTTGTRLGLVVMGDPGDVVDICSLDDLRSQNVDGWTKGDGSASISSMACGNNTIAVGSFNSRRYYPTLQGTTMRYGSSDSYNPGRISPFSSYGTMVDGTTLPHITGPGCTVISSLNYWYTKDKDSNWRNGRAALVKYDHDYYWGTDQGTSMACPAVAGIVALWLQAEPTLTVADVLDVMKHSATTDDDYLASGPAAQLGWGRIDALAGIKKVLAHDYSGISEVFTDSGTGLLVTNRAPGVYEIFGADATGINVEVYNLNGVRVGAVHSDGDTAVLDLESYYPGVYVMRAQGGNAVHTCKIAR